jgi:hypothetical protein
MTLQQAGPALAILGTIFFCTPTTLADGRASKVTTVDVPDGGTLVAWKKDGQLGWQLYDGKGEPSGSPGSAKGPGNGIAGAVGKDGRFILFR